MTTREELHAKIDALSDASLERVAALLEREAFVERQMELLDAFAEGWSPEEAEAFEKALSRRMSWRSEAPNAE